MQKEKYFSLYIRNLYLVMTSLVGIFLSSWFRIHLEFGSPQVNKPSEELGFICTILIIIKKSLQTTLRKEERHRCRRRRLNSFLSLLRLKGLKVRKFRGLRGGGGEVLFEQFRNGTCRQS